MPDTIDIEVAVAPKGGVIEIEIQNKVGDISMDAEPGTGGGSLDHNLLFNRDTPDQHPQDAITGLVSALGGLEHEELSNIDILNILGR